MKGSITIKFYCSDCKEHLGNSERKINKHVFGDKGKKIDVINIDYQERYMYPDEWECKCNRNEEHNCEEHWTDERTCSICGIPQSEYYDAHNCHAHEEGGFCSWCGKDLRTTSDLFAPDLI